MEIDPAHSEDTFQAKVPFKDTVDVSSVFSKNLSKKIGKL